ncbi:MAG: Protein TolB [Anaerolineales bacterium]|nr:Protein TolB [Anaerolineales bacterium]
MSLSPIDGKYSSGKRRSNLFRGEKRRAAIPISLVVLGIIFLLFWLVPVYTLEPVIPLQPDEISTVTPSPTITPSPTATSAFIGQGGRIIFTCTRGDWNQICIVNADGTGYTQITDDPRNHYYPTFSTDGTAVVFAINEGDYFDLYRYDLSKTELAQITFYIGNAFSPKFSPDGKQLMFLNRSADGPVSIWVMGALGESPRKIYSGAQTIVGADWSPDGKNIAFAMSTGQPNSYEIHILDAAQPNQPARRLTYAVEGATGSIDWSPDGQSLLVCLGPAGDKNVFRFDLATSNAIQLTFGGNNASAAYSPDGQYIVYNSLRNNGQADLFVINADGHSTRVLVDNPEPDWQPQWGR